MYQKIKQAKLKHKQSQKIRTESIKLIDFNHQWTHQPENPIENRNRQQTSRDINKSEQKGQKSSNYQEDFKKNIKITANHQLTQEKGQSQNFEVYPKKKAFSQLQSYKKLDLQSLRNRFSKPRQDFHNNAEISNINKKQQEDFTISSAKLKCLKLPEIKKTSRETQIVKRVKLQKLQEINVNQKVKTLKTTTQSQQDSNLDSHFITQTLKNKAQNIKKLNYKMKNARNVTEAAQNVILNKKILPQQKQFQTLEEVKPSVNVKENFSSPVNLNHSQEKSEKNEEISNESCLKLEVYDKKMKIGRKKKRQQDRIRAMLLKTLQKTKGTDYVAQQGSSQTKKSLKSSRITNTQRSLSKDSNQHQNQRQNLILIDPNHKQSSPKISSKSKFDSEKFKKSLIPNNSRFSQHRQPSNYVKNKKFVEMVREVEKKKKFFEQLPEIKQEKTITREDQNLQDLIKAEQQTEKNQFLPPNYEN